MLVIHTTTPTKKEAKSLLKLLLESHLVACGQYCKITSRYVWKDSKARAKLCKQNEYLLILKTLPFYYQHIESLLLAHHSYEVPEILAFEAKAYKGYDMWLHESLSS